MSRITSSVMGLGPPVCMKCMIIGTLGAGAFPWSCPRCHDTHLKGSLWTFTKELQKKIEYAHF